MTPISSNKIPIMSQDYTEYDAQIRFQTYFTDNSSSTILTTDDINIFSSDYKQVYKTQLVDRTKDVFITTFGLEIDRSKYKMQPYSSDSCFEKIDYDTSDY